MNKREAVQTQNYLANGPKRLGIRLGIVGPVLLLGLWLLIAWRGWIKPLYLPRPWMLLEAMRDIQPNIGIQALSTTGLIVAGFVSGTFLGIFVGLVLRHSFVTRCLLTPIIESWRPVPAAAITPFFILWFGFSVIGKVILVSLGVFLVIVVGTLEAIDRLNPVYLRVAASFGASNWRFLRYGVLPAIIPPMLGPMRIAVAVAVSLSVISEYMGATQGLGYIINNAQNNFSTHTILLCTTILGVIGATLDWALRFGHSRLVGWTRVLNEALEIPSREERDSR